MARNQHASYQSIKPFKSSEEYLYAMKEDVAEWLKDLYNIDINVNNVLEALQTGTILCWHANEVTRVAEDFKKFGTEPRVPLPTSGVTFVGSAEPGTFLARDNISNFINWCRKQMGIKDVLMFETDDLVSRKNEKNFVLCLLEVARRASRFGMSAPVLIQLEEEIEEEMREKLVEPPQKAQPKRRTTSNTLNLDQMVQHLICRCRCPTQFPMVKVSDGKYRVGDSSTLIFVRILRNHVMVRVGGGWDTLEHYLDKHDPCRCTSLTHCLAQGPATPVQHKIKGRLTPCPDGPGPVQQPSTLLLSRHAETRLQPVPAGTPSPPLPSSRSTRATKPNPTTKTSVSSGPGLSDSLSVPSSRQRQRAFSQSPSRGPTRSAVSPDPGLWISRELKVPTPNKRQSTSTPTLHHLHDESKDGTVLHSSTRTGREATRSTPTHRLTSSLPRSVQRPSTPQPQRTHILAQSWTKSQIASKLKQTSTSGVKGKESTGSCASQRQGGRSTPRPSTPICGNMNSHQNKTPIPVSLKANNFPFNADHQKNPAERKQNVFGVPNNNKASKIYKVEDRLYEPDRQVYVKPSGKANLQHPSMDSLDNSFCSAPADDVCKNGQQDASQPGLEYSQERLRLDAARSKPPPLTHKYDTVITMYPHETSYTSVVAEHFKCTKRPEKVCVDSWINTLSCSSTSMHRNNMESRSQNVDSSLNAEEAKLYGTSSWASMGSCVKSKEPLLDLGNGVKDNIRQITMATTLNSVNPGTDSTNQDNLEKSSSTSVRPRRALKKSERIPSIYKLKHRPSGRPRHNHRPGKKPSRIPTPISYKASKPTEESDRSRKDTQDTHGHEAPTKTSHLSADEQRSGGIRSASRKWNPSS